MNWHQVPGDPATTWRALGAFRGDHHLTAYVVAPVVLPGARLWELTYHVIAPRSEWGSRLYDTEAEARNAAEGTPTPYAARADAGIWRMMNAVLRSGSLTTSVWGNYDDAIARIWALVNEHTVDEMAAIADEKPLLGDAYLDMLREYTVLGLYEHWMAQRNLYWWTIDALSPQVRDTLARNRLEDGAPSNSGGDISSVVQLGDTRDMSFPLSTSTIRFDVPPKERRINWNGLSLNIIQGDYPGIFFVDPQALVRWYTGDGSFAVPRLNENKDDQP